MANTITEKVFDKIRPFIGSTTNKLEQICKQKKSNVFDFFGYNVA